MFGEFGFRASDYLTFPSLELQRQHFDAAVSASREFHLNGIQAWNPLPIFDLKPGTYRIDSFFPDWDPSHAYPIVVLFGPPQRSIKFYDFTWQLLDEHLKATPAGEILKGAPAQ